MRIIDAHVHLYPTEVDRDPAAWAEGRGERHWAVLCTRRRSDGRPVQTLPTVEGLIAAMDAAQVERAVLLGWYWEKPQTCAWQNRFYAQCIRQYPRRLAAFATLHPGAGHWPTMQEMHRARDEGLIGIGELSPHSQGYSVDDPVFHDILTLASDWKMPVNLHVTDPDSRPFPGRIETPLEDMLRLVRTFPQTKFILSHWGGMLPARFPEAAALPNVYYDTSASPLIYNAGVWPRFFGSVPQEKVLFGSDYPLILYPRLGVEAEIARFVGEARTAGAGEGVLGRNAERLLGI